MGSKRQMNANVTDGTATKKRDRIEITVLKIACLQARQ